jgi:GNAT superfamily N-acetyltransferase
MRYGKVYITSPKLEGISLWQLRDPKEEQEQESKHTRVFANWNSFGLWIALGKGLERVNSLYEHVFSTHDELMPLRHWYFYTIGVDPNFQGQGFGSRLIRPMLARIDEEQLPCYLDTNTEKNVALYEHYGFKVVKRYQIPGSEVINWSMVRENPE